MFRFACRLAHGVLRAPSALRRLARVDPYPILRWLTPAMVEGAVRLLEGRHPALAALVRLLVPRLLALLIGLAERRRRPRGR